MKKRKNSLISLFLMLDIILSTFFGFFHIWEKTYAGTLTDVAASITNASPLAEDVSYTISFHLATTQKMQMVKFYFRKSESDENSPEHLSFGESSNISHNLSGLWTVSDPGPLITLTNGEQGDSITELPANTEVSMTVSDVTNPELDDCSVSGQFRDECYILVQTYAYIPAEGETPAQENVLTDSGYGKFELTDTPFLDYWIAGEPVGQTHNGITTTKSADFNKLEFGTLEYTEPTYIAQKISIKTNAPHGYAVTMRLKEGTLQGLYPANNIDPFIPDTGNGWNNPALWETPTSTTANSDTGWFGANTTDIRVAGWGDGTGKFGPVANGWREVLSQTGRDRSLYEIFVTYAMEINTNQPSDLYSGVIEYSVLARY